MTMSSSNWRGGHENSSSKTGRVKSRPLQEVVSGVEAFSDAFFAPPMKRGKSIDLYAPCSALPLLHGSFNEDKVLEME